MLTPYHILPPNSKVWIYQANRSFSQDEVREISDILENFTDSWKSHGQALEACGSIYYRRFIVLVANTEKCSVGGCSIYESTKLIEEIEKAYQISLFDRMKVSYKISTDLVGCFPFTELNNMLGNGKINEDTIVFNNLVETKIDFETKWEISLKDSPYFKFVMV
ncbi:MAG: hypothetical protein KA457_01605 [Chitinophagales bacterium]|nr:hypothetical protein [Chitinophagales bacterium]MBP6153484.1 hypothetical protein [Chitinophagales bacterium]